MGLQRRVLTGGGHFTPGPWKSSELGETRYCGWWGQVWVGWGKEPGKLVGILPGPTPYLAPHSGSLKTVSERLRQKGRMNTRMKTGE